MTSYEIFAWNMEFLRHRHSNFDFRNNLRFSTGNTKYGKEAGRQSRGHDQTAEL